MDDRYAQFLVCAKDVWSRVGGIKRLRTGTRKKRVRAAQWALGRHWNTKWSHSLSPPASFPKSKHHTTHTNLSVTPKYSCLPKSNSPLREFSVCLKYLNFLPPYAAIFFLTLLPPNPKLGRITWFKTTPLVCSKKRF